MSKQQARAARTAPPADPLDRRRADWDATVAAFRETLREGHELLGALRAERAQTAKLLAACDPAALAAVVDDRIGVAIAEGLEGYKTRIGGAITDAEARVLTRFDTLVGALLGDDDPEGGLEGALRRFQDRQRFLEAAMAKDPKGAAAGAAWDGKAS